MNQLKLDAAKAEVEHGLLESSNAEFNDSPKREHLDNDLIALTHRILGINFKTNKT